METLTVSELVTRASERRGRKARRLRRYLRNPTFREEFEDTIAEELRYDTRFVELVPLASTADFDADALFEVESEEVGNNIIDLILEYGPSIMEFVLKYIIPLFT